MLSLISGVPDALALQGVLASFAAGSATNGLSCNINKFKFLSYHCKLTLTKFTYKLNVVELSRTNTVRDISTLVRYAQKPIDYWDLYLG